LLPLAGALAFLGLFLAGAAQEARGQGDKKPVPKKFIRLQPAENGKPMAFQTATGRYTSAKGDVTIDLIGVVHVGEKKYYEKYNELFKGYDVVLYEAAGGPITGKPSGLDFDPLNLFYKSLTKAMRIDEQLQVVDYTAPNFVHADLSVKDLPEVLNKRGDNLLSLFLSIAADMIREHNLAQAKMQKEGKKVEKFNAMSLLTDPQAPYKLRHGMAKELVENESGLGFGKTVDSLVIDERNEMCMKVLAKQLAAGKKKIAIFYGAAHMPDFEQRLIRDHNMRAVGMDWYTAWEIVEPMQDKKGEEKK
jgi:hypothetical protein